MNHDIKLNFSSINNNKQIKQVYYNFKEKRIFINSKKNNTD